MTMTSTKTRSTVLSHSQLAYNDKGDHDHQTISRSSVLATKPVPPSLSHPQSPQLTITPPNPLALSSPKSPGSVNTIQFPSSSPTLILPPTDITSGDRNEKSTNPWAAFDRLIKHWLTIHFEPDDTHTDPDLSTIPELDILVGFKSISDQLNLPQLDREEVWEKLLDVFPGASSWAKPVPPGLRSEQEFVVIGIKPRDKTASQHSTASNNDRPEETWSDDQIHPFDQLDFSKPIPSGIHSTELIEYMRRRICELQPQANLNHSRVPFGKAKSSTYTSQGQGVKKKTHHHTPFRLFRFDHRQTPAISEKMGSDAVHLLGSRIWSSVIEACRYTKDNFDHDEILVASWMERMNKSDFDLICKHCKASQARTSETTSNKIIKIGYPFHKTTQIKLFKLQPIEDFNALVLNNDRRQSNIDCVYQTSGSADDFSLKGFKIDRISSHHVLNQSQQCRQNKFSSLSKAAFLKNIKYNHDDKKSEPMLNHQYDRRRGRSLDPLTNLTGSNVDPLEEQIYKQCDKEARPIGGFLEQMNQNFQHKRKSLTLDKLFHYRHHPSQQHHPTPPKPDSVRPKSVDLIRPYARPSSTTLILQEIAIEFNLLRLNQLKFQIKLLKEESSHSFN